MKSATERSRLVAGWLMQAAELHQKGHFAKYSVTQREQVLQKGFVGQWPPDEAIVTARTLARHGHYFVTPRFHDQLRDHFGLVGEDAREALLAILDEVAPEWYQPPANLEKPPGSPFIFRCETLKREIYFKFQITGSKRKPQVLFWSCHPPLY